jgi:hypothetical protein
MTLFEFEMLSDAEKIAFLYEEGTYIGKRSIHGSCLLLFQLEGFYVEILYQKYRTLIKNIDCFTSTERIEPYLEQMNVENLVKQQIE